METYHFHDVEQVSDRCGTACFDLTRFEVGANLESESDLFRAWILSNPAIGDKFHGQFNDILLVQRT